MDQGGQVKGHFGTGESVRLYLVEDAQIVMERNYPMRGSGYSAMNELLSLRVSVVICDAITPACRIVLTDNGVRTFTGVKGTTEDAIQAFLQGKLEANEADSGCSGSCSSCASKCH